MPTRSYSLRSKATTDAGQAGRFSCRYVTAANFSNNGRSRASYSGGRYAHHGSYNTEWTRASRLSYGASKARTSSASVRESSSNGVVLSALATGSGTASASLATVGGASSSRSRPSNATNATTATGASDDAGATPRRTGWGRPYCFSFWNAYAWA